MRRAPVQTAFTRLGAAGRTKPGVVSGTRHHADSHPVRDEDVITTPPPPAISQEVQDARLVAPRRDLAAVSTPAAPAEAVRACASCGTVAMTTLWDDVRAQRPVWLCRRCVDRWTGLWRDNPAARYYGD